MSTIVHGTLQGLDADDHTQYVHINTPREIAAVHTFNPESAGAPFILGSNAQGHKVAGLNADLLDGIEGDALKSAVYASVVLTGDSTVSIGARGVLNICNTTSAAQIHTLPALGDIPEGWTIGFLIAGANTVTVKDSVGATLTDGVLSVLKTVRWFTSSSAGWVVSSSVYIAGSIAHSSLTGLTGSDDHTQYVHITTARTITAVHTLNPTSAGPAFTLGANATDQLISGLNADKVDGYQGAALLGPLAGLVAASGNTSVNVDATFHGKLIVADTTAGDITINLEDPAAYPANWCVGLQKTAAGSTVTFTPAGGITVDQATVTANGETVWLYRKSATAYGILNKFYAGVTLNTVVQSLEFSDEGADLALKATPRTALVVGSAGSAAPITNGVGEDHSNV